jgi:hypothetical protein
MQLLERYGLSNQKDDLDKSILYLTESLLISPLSWLAHGWLIGGVLYHLALSLFVRSSVSKEPEDATYAARYLRHLRNAAPAALAVLGQSVASLLVKTLAVQMELKASDLVQTLEEMAILTHELLTSDPSSAFTTHAIVVFVFALNRGLPLPFPDEPMNQIIKCLRLARMHKPEMGEVHLSFARCLVIRYYTMNDELDDAVSILDEVMASVSESHGDKAAAICQEAVANLAALRLAVEDDPEVSEDAIYRARAFLASSSPEEAPVSYLVSRPGKCREEPFQKLRSYRWS